MFNPNASTLLTIPDTSNADFDFSYNDLSGNLPVFLKSDSVPFKVQQNVHLAVSNLVNSNAQLDCHKVLKSTSQVCHHAIYNVRLQHNLGCQKVLCHQNTSGIVFCPEVT